ncbi:MAG TPA: DUF72 domain-containing protein [Geomonas sp.]|nr:DUF72 domain-containing protein [Geomonas sp.]
MSPAAIRVGTCSWTEKSLLESGAFYPAGISSPEARLKYYASRFDTVEIDSSYYALPSRQMAEAWCQRTPERFLFHVKAYGALTGHCIDPGLLPAELRKLLPTADRQHSEVHVSESEPLREMAAAMVEALVPLKKAGKLGFLIFQFPPWFTCKNANRDYILHCKELMQGLPIAVEFRHGSWLTRQHAAETFAFLKEHKITYITCDEPQLGTLETAPFRPEATTSMAYLRMHGRNPDRWLNPSINQAEYLYNEDEITSLASLARRLSFKARTVFIMFNNCQSGNAIVNARQLQERLLRQSGDLGHSQEGL